MNHKLIIVGCLSVATLFSCNDLDVPPMNIIQDEDVFSTESGITAYMARMYSELPIEDFKFKITDGFEQDFPNPGSGICTGEYMLNRQHFIYDSPSGEWFQAWNYSAVRNINYFLQTFPSYEESYSEEQCDNFLGEAYFLRAFNYFAMVKRYGGIPIIKEVQNFPEQNLEELQVPRNTEQEVYDFIAEDLNKAIELLPETSVSKGRVNKNVAYALLSRAMLYAASIAQYGTIQLDGILGIPASEAKRYYELSYNASKALDGKYSLYNKYSDKFENYWQLFLDEESPENIFCKYYVYPEYAHNFDMWAIPFQMRGAEGYGSGWLPTLDLVKMFDDVDGNSDWLKIGTNASPVRYEKRTDLFAKAEPRLRASVIFPGDEFKGEVIDVQQGLYESYPDGKLHTSSEPTNIPLYNGVPVIGKSGMGANETTNTGFFVRKYQNPNLNNADVTYSKSTTPYIECRYAEILLNRAEAAYALGKKEDALNCVNQIRERAGAKPYTTDQLDEKSIQKERRMELAFENHTYWDLRRWRIADSEINNRKFKALCPYYIYDENKYIFKEEELSTPFTFQVKVYYQQIPTTEIATNPNLVQNPGY
ncbi:RagB/SusD family nutrient uptake outer membrane protein [uncultured Parabacteroides sp.]|uniref:RagB/SusD family nutrient uptake outer membrane protein n=1 Tax=uncultured Parabacteroides sp. TaxID=512312 RepID=UPI002607EB46|nr:RagB/SusD family nutrient uptake outer membrane protein [uncultured Parabacteroides sp.]